MTSPQEIRIPGASVELAARRWTSGDTPVLALHGWLDNAATYDRLAPYLSGIDLVAIDFPGHGHSGHRPKEGSYPFVTWVAEVFAAARSLRWDRFILLGHSMGAGVASLAAGTYPDRIKAAVLIEGLGPFSSPESEAPHLLARALSYQPSSTAPAYPTFEHAVQRLQSRGLSSEGATAIASRALAQSADDFRFRYDTHARAPSASRFTEGQVRAFLRAITAPTLLVTATDGLAVPPSFAGRDQEVANLQSFTCEGGHHLHLDFPQRIAETVQNFLAQHS